MKMLFPLLPQQRELYFKIEFYIRDVKKINKIHKRKFTARFKAKYICFSKEIFFLAKKIKEKQKEEKSKKECFLFLSQERKSLDDKIC